MTWKPTETFLRGKIVKPFLPFEKHPTLQNNNLKNLYPGDEIYIFETKDNRWARAYVLCKPFPNDFTITSVNLDELPGMNIHIVVFPLKYSIVIEKIPISKIEVDKGFNNIVNDDIVPTIQDSEIAHKLAVNGELDSETAGYSKCLLPQLPINKFNKTDDLLAEVKNALDLLTSHIFALYSIGEFRLFNKLSGIYYNLDQTRVKLLNNLLTANESRVAKETATYLLDKVPKKLASKAARLNAQSYDLDNTNTDISGYKAILSRDAFTGELLSSDVSPSRMALNQVLCALAPNFPINSHTHMEDYSLNPKPNKKLFHEPPSHVLVDFKSVSGASSYQPPGFAGMIAYLYIRNHRKRLTEAFAIHTNSVDDLVHVEKISAALFRNIPASEIEHGRVYLVAVLTEEIDLKNKSGNNQIKKVKKGVAAGVADITRIFSKNQGALESGEAHQFSIRLFGSFVEKEESGRDKPFNNGWGELVDRIISGSNVGVAVNPRAEKLIVTIKEFKHQFVDNFAPVGSTAPISRIKPIFFDPLAENYERIYLTMRKASLYNKPKKEDLLTFEISTPNNDMITFAKATNQQEKHNWHFVSVGSGEVVGEIVKVNGVALKNQTKKLSKEDHILLRLYVNGDFVGDGKVLYRSGNRIVEFKNKTAQTVEIMSPQGVPVGKVEINSEYIGKAFNSDLSIDNIFQYETFFKHGQSGIDELSSSLVSFVKLDIAQLLRYFPELLSTLFHIADLSIRQSKTFNTEILQDNTFKAFIHLMDTLFGKQEQYLYMMDTFTQKNKNLPPIGIFLLNRIGKIFSRAESNWNSVSRSLCRVSSLLIKLAIVSISPDSSLEPYEQSLSSLFKSCTFFLSIQSSTLVSDQVLVLEIIDYVLTFKTHMDQLKILGFINNFIDSIGIRGLGANEDSLGIKKITATPKDHKIIISKLLLIHRLFNTSLVESPETRELLVSKAVTWVMEVLLGPTDVDASRLACSIMNTVCNLLWKTVFVANKTEEINLCISLSKLLPAFSRTIIKYNKFTRGNEFFKPKRTYTQLFPTEYPFKESSIDPIVNDEVIVEIMVELSTVFCYIAKIGKATAGNEGYSKILAVDIPNDFFIGSKYLAADFQNEDILTLISGVKLIRQGKFFPEDKWLSLYATLAEGCLISLELVRPLLLAHCIPPLEESDQFDRVIWGNYLLTLLKLAALPPVAIEHLSDVPRKACFQITGTMRDRIAFLVNEAWDALAWDAPQEDVLRFNLNKFGGYQVEFISNDFGILQDLMLFALQNNHECQSVSVKILWSIIVSEYILSDSIIDVERECLMGLHEVYYRNSYKPMVSEQESFIRRIKLTIRLDREDEAFGMIYNFIETLSGFLLVLNDLRSVPVGPEFDDDRTFHELNINAYLKNANKPELFHSFINSMYEEKIEKNDFVQGALSLELLASTYTWNHNDILPASFRPKFPQQSSFERKEILYTMIAKNYIKGNRLERATDIYNELLDAYNEHTYDLKSFANVHTKLAKLYLDLESSEKLNPSFFKVAYIGAGFPVNIRGKQQIYEGLPFEHITSIHDRLLKLYPGARIVSDDSEAQKLRERIQTGRYLHVSAIEPVNEISDKLFNTSIGVRQYARNKDLRHFTTMKKIPGATSVFDLWTEETTYETYLSFPTLMNRSEIKTTRVIKLSPLDNAIRTIVDRNNDLIQLESLLNMAFKEKADFSALLNDLSRQLAGTVDSPVNGGVGQYRTFFSEYEGVELYKSKIKLLKNAFNDLTIILNRCLHLHGKLISQSMKLPHEALVELYKKNFQKEIETLKISTDYDHSVYNFNAMQHYQPSIHNSSDKRSTSAMSNAMIGSKLTKTTSRSSNTSSNSSRSGLSSKVSLNNSTFSSLSNSQKRTALNWRNIVRS